MSDEKTFTYSDVSQHNSKKDLHIVVHDKVYNATTFIDEHPGGEEVLLDVGGQDATEAFEDVGHSDEARDILKGLKIGDLERKPGDPQPKTTTTQSTASTAPSKSSGGGFGLYAILVVGVAVAFGAYQYLQTSKDK